MSVPIQPSQAFPTTRRAVGAGLAAAALAAPIAIGAVSAQADPRTGDGDDRDGADPAPRRGPGESIIDPDLPIVDALHHLFVREGTRYLLDEYLADARAGHRIVASVYMQASAFLRPAGPPALRGLGEVESANGMSAMAASGSLGDVRACAGIVGNVDLRDADAGRFLDAAIACAPDRFRGIRQGANHSDDPALKQLMPDQPPAGLLADAAFRRGFAMLEPRGLTFDAAVFHPQLGEVAALADAFPNTVIVLNHAGIALGVGRYADRREAVFDDWRRDMHALAQRENVRCKLGGFGLPFWGFGFDKRPTRAGSAELADAWRPYVQEAVEAFGADRCMMVSNYPPDRAAADFVPLWNALKRCAAGAGAEEKAALFSGTAARTYRIDIEQTEKTE